MCPAPPHFDHLHPSFLLITLCFDLYTCVFQNLVMFLGLLVAWVIPDVPKNISEQIKREKTLLVDVFMKEEKEKLQLIHSLFSKESGSLLLQETRKQVQTVCEPQAPLPNLTQAEDSTVASRPRTRARAASFSQFTRQASMSPQNDGGSQTAV